MRGVVVDHKERLVRGCLHSGRLGQSLPYGAQPDTEHRNISDKIIAISDRIGGVQIYIKKGHVMAQL